MNLNGFIVVSIVSLLCFAPANAKPLATDAEGRTLLCGEHIEPSFFGYDTISQNEGLRIRCQEIPALEKRALAGSGVAGRKLAEFFGGIQQSPKDELYWYTVAAENGDVRGMEWVGTILSSNSSSKDEANMIRGRFWLDRAAKIGSKVAPAPFQNSHIFLLL